MIYKILTRDEWSAAQDLGEFIGSEVDRRDGFIHFSAAAQLHDTARLHFSGVQGLVVLEVREEELGDSLRWEPSRGGILFPHVYGPLAVEQVIEVYDAPLDEAGTPQLRFLD